jgi:quinol monooxygenase YgiN
VQATHSISASFAAIPSYTLTASAGANGAISPSGSIQVIQGASQTFTITANTGYTVSAVAVDGTSVGAVTSYTFSNVQAAHSISASFAVTTPAITITTQPVATAAKVGQTATFSVAASSNVGVISYQWYRKLATDTYYSAIAGATSSSCGTPVLALSDQASYFFVRMVSGGVTQDSVRVPLTVTPVITISTQPAATTVTAGLTATFSVAATANAGTISYQWYRMRPLQGETVFGAISGATGASLTTPVLAATDNGSYYFVRLTDAGTVSDSVRPVLTVLPAITITTDLVAQAAKIGQTATFTVAATTNTGSISYQWYRKLATVAFYSAIAGATTESYTTPVLAASDQASYFFVRLTNGKTVVDSVRVPLTVTPVVTISSQPLATSAKIGQTATFAVAASANGGSISYQWYRKPATATVYTAIAGATGPSLTTTALTADDNGSYYFVRLSDSGTVADSTRVPLTVIP